ncbi:MAG: hypothetical protein F6K22_03330 [Okeania sp. SIO2F4]|nr:hypothetical protein [Okeania sp. SIO2F4]
MLIIQQNIVLVANELSDAAPSCGGFPHERLPVRQGGLYKTKQGKLINADANGAANIGVKSNLNGFIPDRRLGIFGYAIKGKI